MPGQEGRQVLPDGDGTYAGTATAVRYAEGLVQVQVRYVGAERPGLRQPDQRVQVGPVDVYLAAGGVHEVADLADRRLEHAVGRRVGKHDRRDRALMLVQLAAQVMQVDGAVGTAFDHDHLHAGQDRKSTRLNSSHEWTSYAVFCLKKKKK